MILSQFQRQAMANANYRENTHFSSIFFLQKQIESNYNRILINISGGTVAYHMVNHLLVVLSWLSARISCHPWHQLSFFRSSEICPLQLKVMVSLSLKTSALVCSQRYDMNRDIKREMWKSLTHTFMWRGKKLHMSNQHFNYGLCYQMKVARWFSFEFRTHYQSVEKQRHTETPKH